MCYLARSDPARTHPGFRRAFPTERRSASGVGFRLTADPGSPGDRPHVTVAARLATGGHE